MTATWIKEGSSSFESIVDDKLSSLSVSSDNSIVRRAVTAAAANMQRRTSTQYTGTVSKQYPVSVFYSKATEQDLEIQDDLAKGKKSLLLRHNYSSNYK